jgi:hypothetical protein
MFSVMILLRHKLSVGGGADSVMLVVQVGRTPMHRTSLPAHRSG